MATKLDRVVTLLDVGSTQLIRNEAAQQLAEIQKNHPDDLFNLLTRVVPYLKSKKWDTRIAAAKAIAGIAENCAPFDPNGDEGEQPKEDPDGIHDEQAPVKKEEEDQGDGSQDQLQLETLDLEAILVNGKKLLASSGQQYDGALLHLDPGQRLAHQKKTLNARLGLAGEYAEDDLIEEGDVKTTKEMPTTGIHKINTLVERSSSMSAMSASPSFDGDTPTTPADGGMSKRQLNALKRKNKRELKDQSNKVRVVDFSERRTSSMQTDQTPIKPEPVENDASGRPDYFSLERTGGDDQSTVVQEFKGEQVPIKSELQPEAEEEGIEWPFERLCEHLTVDMFDHTWEVRHGAAMALRDVLRVHGGCAGREQGNTKLQNDLLNQKWLEDIACRICCIFMLDRFGDYVSDNVVSPVRETAGQTLGAILKYLPDSSLRAAYQLLQQLVRQKNFSISRVWQACHGGMLGLRYLVAVRTEFFLSDEALINDMLDVVIKGLSDFDDDVRSVSATTLIPVAEDVVKRRPVALPKLLKVVWDCLSNLSDDLSSSTGAVMDLLSKLCSYTEVLETMKENAAGDAEQTFTELVPRLYPFLRHTIVSVRSSALKALGTFLSIKGEGTQDWIDGRAMRLVFQNLLVERNELVLKLSLDVWHNLVNMVAAQDPQKLESEFSSHLQPMMTLTLHPIGVPRHHIPMPSGLLIRPSGQMFVLPYYGQANSPGKRDGSEPPAKKRRRSKQNDREMTPPPVSANNIDNPMMQGDVDLVGTDVLIRTRVCAAKGLAKAMSLWPQFSRQATFESMLVAGIGSPYASTRVTAAIASEEYAKLTPELDELGTGLVSALLPVAEEEDAAFFAELKNYLVIAQQQCVALKTLLEKATRLHHEKLPHIGGNSKVQGEEYNKYSFCVSQAEEMIGPGLDKAKSMMTPAAKITMGEQIEAGRRDAERETSEAKAKLSQCSVRVKAASSAAIVAFNSVPKKPSATIKGLMDSIKSEENVELQRRSAMGVFALIKLMVSSNRKVVVDKVVGNLAKFYCEDAAETPDFQFNKNVESGLLSLRKDEDIAEHEDPAKYAQDAKDARIKRRGAREALEQLATGFGPKLFDNVPVLKSLIQEPLQEALRKQLPHTIIDGGDDLGQRVVDGMSTLRAILPKLDSELHFFVVNLMPYIIAGVKCKLAALRYTAAKCLATICSVISADGFTALVKEVLPSINNANDVNERQGAIECVYHLINVMEDRILPYVIFLIVPVLGRMSDSDNDVRLIATTTFATLVKLVPLEAGIPDPPGLSKDLLEGRERERKFMSQMLDFKKVEAFEIPVAIKAELRSYQQEGVNWLAFLSRYHLHGVLCDDMGLGKTLQTLCIVASDHHMRAEEFEKTQNLEMRRLPSLIICPPTLSGHWQQEIQQFAPFLRAVAYVGSQSERERARAGIDSADIVITSYEICRNNIELFAAYNWNYCVLDEGHLIKNPNAKTTLAVKRIVSNHRLILSGTPIQNNVLELWSLFDFLMPGFLGTEKVFKDRFAKPIAASRYSKSSSKEQEAGALAIEALHKQVLPFLLRRLKEEVLDDLPPKIIQNYYCELSDLQRKLFENFTKKAGRSLTEKVASGDKEAKQHIFQALQYMRKLCNSPQLVLKPGKDTPQLPAIEVALRAKNTNLKDPIHAPKLGALKQLLLDCGIGSDAPPSSSNDELPTSGPAVSQHRALIFCQMKEMLDIVQHTVLGQLLPTVSHLRLDGSVDPSHRQSIVNKFNSDPSIDVLLLTTSVGGLGLNLTGADTVIFVEHDWNPQKDIQAMDRAHRIGQKKVVNVYRLITRGTLEEKILNLQRFKIDVASTVVNQQNSGLATMETDQILDLFNVDEGGMGGGGQAGEGGKVLEGADGADAVDEVTGEVREKGKKGFLDGVQELWDENQYDEEFDLERFLERTK